MNPGWSYILTAIGVFGLWLAGRKDWRIRSGARQARINDSDDGSLRKGGTT